MATGILAELRQAGASDRDLERACRWAYSYSAGLLQESSRSADKLRAEAHRKLNGLCRKYGLPEEP